MPWLLASPRHQQAWYWTTSPPGMSRARTVRYTFVVTLQSRHMSVIAYQRDSVSPATPLSSHSGYRQCSKLSQKSCQSSCLESQIINIKLKKILKKVPGPPPKLSASGRRTGSNLEHWYRDNFLFLYRFLHHRVRRRRRRRRPQTFCSRNNFSTTFRIFKKNFAGLMALAYRLPDWILVDFRRDLDLEFSRSKGNLLSLIQNGPVATQQKANIYRLNSRSQMRSLDLTLAMTLTLNFQGQIWN